MKSDGREPFASAALAVVDGDLEGLSVLLGDHPGLVLERSRDDFGATLLHHVAANGIADELQRTPGNAVDVARLLLGRGADPDALLAAPHGGPGSSPLCLLVSSWPPFERGLQVPLVHALVEGGARPCGVGGEGLPLSTALTFGYTRTAEALAELGAPAGHPFAAAGLGLLPELQRAVGEASPQSDELDPWTPLFGRSLPGRRQELLQESLHFAVTHGRLDVADWLLSEGASVQGRTEGHHSELPLLQAVFVREFDAARRLRAAGADPDQLCAKRGETARQHAANIDPALPGALGF